MANQGPEPDPDKVESALITEDEPAILWFSADVGSGVMFMRGVLD